MPLTTPPNLPDGNRVGLANPQSEIRLYMLRNCDISYNNVMRFKDLEDVNTYFSGIYNVNITDSKIVRYPDHIRIPFNCDYIRKFNYISFKNKDEYDVGTSQQNDGYPAYNQEYVGVGNYNDNPYSQRTIYCFITEVIWVNVHCCDVYYKVDAFTTYFWDIEPQMSFVSRSHIYQGADEKIGDSLEGEPITVNNYEYTVEQVKPLLCDVVIIGINPQSPKGMIIGAGYSAVEYYAFSLGEIDPQYILPSAAIDAFIDSHASELVTVFQVPKELLGNFTSGKRLDGGLPERFTVNITANYLKSNPYSDYKVKNKKVFNFPFCAIQLYTGDRRIVTYSPQLFENTEEEQHTVSFFPYFAGGESFIAAGFSTYKKGSLFTIPYFKLGISEFSPETTVFIQDFPSCPVDVDAWQSFIQSGGMFKIGASVLNGVGQGLSQAALNSSLGGAGAATGIAGSAFSAITEILNVASIMAQPDETQGSNNGQARNCSGFYSLYCRYVYPTLDELKTIDDYFEMFGYATNKVMIPDFQIRPYWCFWQIPNFNFTTYRDSSTHKLAVPNEFVTEIKAALANGVTFWERGEDFGDYSKDNHAE